MCRTEVGGRGKGRGVCCVVVVRRGGVFGWGEGRGGALRHGMDIGVCVFGERNTPTTHMRCFTHTHTHTPIHTHTGGGGRGVPSPGYIGKSSSCFFEEEPEGGRGGEGPGGSQFYWGGLLDVPAGGGPRKNCSLSQYFTMAE